MQETNYEVVAAFIVVVGIIATIAITTFGTITKAQTLERDPIPAIPIVDNVTGEAEPIQMTITPDESLPPNGTVILSMQGMNDIDFKRTPPQGITVIVTNESATVTNHPVQLPDVPTAQPTAAAAAPAPETGSSGSGGSNSNGDESDEG